MKCVNGKECIKDKCRFHGKFDCKLYRALNNLIYENLSLMRKLEIAKWLETEVINKK